MYLSHEINRALIPILKKWKKKWNDSTRMHTHTHTKITPLPHIRVFTIMGQTQWKKSISIKMLIE